MQKHPELVDFCPFRSIGIGNCITNSELTKLESRYTKPGGSLEVRIG